jgi:transcriptional regulator with XRE-family HTH domain/quercetin dioxygenase-like cupin family protein
VTATSGSPAASDAPRRRRSTSAQGTSVASTPTGRSDITGVGGRLRAQRLAAGLSLRQFARDLGVSASLVSQIENGKSRPSVGTLYAICSALNLSIDELFSNVGAGDTPRPQNRTEATQADHPTHSFRGALAELDEPKQRAAGPVVQPGDRRQLVLDSGVTWDQLSAAHESDVDFLFVRYEVGGSSVHSDHLTRHSGIEYGYIISGTLDVSLGFETHRIGAGDAISFDSSTPHRLTNNGDVPVEAIWFVHGRNHTGY